MSMVRAQLDERQWLRLTTILESQRGAGRRGKNDRGFIEAVLWWLRTGVPWRDLPTEFGPWQTVFNRFDRWSVTGRWTRLFAALRSDPDDEWHSLDSTINRAHQHAASSQACASLISIATTRTSIDLPAFWPASSRSSSLQQTSSRAADSVAEPRAVR